jgi:O-antigen/teichoic acid export membrane protein
LMPRMALSARTNGGMARLARFVTAVIALVSIPLVLGTIATARITVPLILGAKYTDSVWLVQLMAPYVMTAATASFLTGTVLYALGLHRSYLNSTACGAVAGTLLYVVLTPTLGLMGAGLAYVLAEAVVAAAAYVQLPQDLHGLWRNRMIPVAFVCGVLMFAVVEATTKLFAWPIAVIGAGVTVYLVSSAWFVKKWITREFGTS